MTSATNYQGLRISATPCVPSERTYELLVQNLGDLELWAIEFDLEEVLGPWAFGLDDTYMKRSPEPGFRIAISHLPVGAKDICRREGWGTFAQRSERKPVIVYATFSVRADGQAWFGQRVPVDVRANAS